MYTWWTNMLRVFDVSRADRSAKFVHYQHPKAHSLSLPQRAANNNEMEKWRDEEAESAKHIKRLISTRLAYYLSAFSLLTGGGTRRME